MTVHFFTYGSEQSGSSRQRAFKVADKLNARGMRAFVHRPSTMQMSATKWPKKGVLILQLLRALTSVKKGDIVYLQRTISNKYFFVIMVAYLLVSRRKMIFDFDDPVYVHTLFKTVVFTKMADTVVVCSHGQKEWALRHNPKVHLLHISLDFPAYATYTKKYAPEQNPLVIGWVGNGPEHIEHFKVLVPVFEKLLAETTTSFKFRLIGALKDKKVYEVFNNIRGLTVDYIDSLDWTDPESIPREIQKFDIGIMPHLSDGTWNQNKTAFKHLEYMACGVATIVSTFGEMPYIFCEGVNGYMASSTDEWVSKLQNLLSDKELRMKIGLAGQKTVREEYCYEVMIPRLIELINSVSESSIS